MTSSSFALGFMTALLVLGVSMAALLLHLRGARKKKAPIRGYLDLIPDLSKNQRERVQEIHRTFLPKVESIRQNLRLERAELARLLFEEPSDKSKIYAVAEQILSHQSELENEVIEHILEERELLSPSQKRKVYEIIVEQFSSGGLGVHDVRCRRS